MGILDPKSRVIDLLLTNEGKRQLVNGQMRTEFISFSDSSVNYLDEDIEKIILEANNLPQDTITSESDDNELIKKLITSNFKINNGNVYDIRLNSLKTGSINDYFDEVSNSSLENFKKLQIIKSFDSFEQIKQLQSNIISSSFFITGSDIHNHNDENDNKPVFNLSVDVMPSVFLDVDTSKTKNYLYLPPVDNLGKELFNYGFKKGTNQIINDDLLNNRLKDKKKIEYKLTSSGNTHIQFFQSESNNKLKKLDIIKYGNLYDNKIFKGVAYFIGRLIIDNSGNSTFYRMFTVLIK